MTKVITIPKFQITDVNREEETIRVWYTAPGDNHEQAIDFPSEHFASWLEESNHLDQHMTYPMGNVEDGSYHDEVVPCTLTWNEFWLEENDFIWPILHEYIEAFHRKTTFDSTINAMNSIFSHFNLAK